MDTKLDSQMTIAVNETGDSIIDAHWIQQVDGHILKISIVGSVPYNLMMASKLAAELNSSVSSVVCHHIVDIDLVD